MNNHVSVVVPVYNVEKYIISCIRSIQEQTYEDLEIIIVDDGSTDSSGKLADKIAEDDSRITVVHEKNGGLSAARNMGLNKATGEYITFIDSDDMVAPEFIFSLLSAARNGKADVSVCDYRVIDDGCNKVAGEGNGSESPAVNSYSAAECLKHMYHPETSGMSFTTWAKLYRKKLFTDNDMEFPVGRIHEDTFTTYRLIYFANRIEYVQSQMYCYRKRSGSIMHLRFDTRHLELKDATREQCDFFADRNEKELYSLAVNNHIRSMFTLLVWMRENTDSPEKAEREMVGELRTDIKKYLPEADIPYWKKMLFRVAAVFPDKLLLQQLKMW